MAEATEATAVTHLGHYCIDSCVGYCELVAGLVTGTSPAQALAEVTARAPVGADVRMVLAWAPRLPASWLCPGGDVLHPLAEAVWALCQPEGFEEVLEELVGLGGDRAAAVAAGALLGTARGLSATPRRLIRSGFRERLGLSPQLLAVRRAGTGAAALAGAR